MVETRHAERRLSEELADTRTQLREILLLQGRNWICGVIWLLAFEATLLSG
jgi:hypothetical protein